MTLRTLTGTGTSGSSSLVVVGAGSAESALSDDLDTSYVKDDGSTLTHYMDVGTTTPPANEWAAGAQFRLRHSTDGTGTPYQTITARVVVGTSLPSGPVEETKAGGAIGYWYSVMASARTLTAAADVHRSLTQAEIDALQLQYRIRTSYLYQALVRLYTTSAPTVSVSVSGTDRTRPQVGFTYADRWEATVTNKQLTSNVATLTTSGAHGWLVGNEITVSSVDSTFNGTWIITAVTSTTLSYACTAANVTSQAATGLIRFGENKPFSGWDVRVFDAATQAGAGFSPDTSTPVWSERVETGSTTYSTPARTIGVDLPNGSYWAYVRTVVYDSYGMWPQTGQYAVTTDWASSSFTVAVTPAAPAAITAAWNPTTQAVDVVCTTRGNLIPPQWADNESTPLPWGSTAQRSTARVADTGVVGAYACEVTVLTSAVTSLEVNAGTAGVGLPGVIGGEQYLLKIPIRAMTETRSVTATITWRNDSNTSVGTVTTPAVSPTTGDNWTRYLTVNAAAPATATRFTLTIDIAGPPTVNAKWRLDGLWLVPATSSGETVGTIPYGQGGPGAGYTGLRTCVRRSTDGGATWTQVRAAAGVDQTAAGINAVRATITDYEAPRGVTAAQYRADLVAGSPAGVSYGTVATVNTAGDGTWWLKAILVPTLNRGGLAVNDDPQYAIDEQLAVLRPLGRGAPVVVATDLGGEDGQATIHTRSASEHAAVLALLRHQGVLLLQSPFADPSGVGLQWWVRMVSRGWVLRGTPADPRRPIAVQWVDVGMPTIGT